MLAADYRGERGALSEKGVVADSITDPRQKLPPLTQLYHLLAQVESDAQRFVREKAIEESYTGCALEPSTTSDHPLNARFTVLVAPQHRASTLSELLSKRLDAHEIKSA